MTVRPTRHTESEGGAPSGPLPRSRRAPLLTIAVVLLLGGLLGRFVFLGDDTAAPADPAAAAASELDQALVAARRAPNDPDALRRVGLAHLARFRETADAAAVAAAADALEASRDLAPDDPDTLLALGLVALTRHEFDAALELGTRAASLRPDASEPLGVVVDALIELGRYDEARVAAQTMIDRKPTLASLSRASYITELSGNRPMAVALLQQALNTGAGSKVERGYLHTVLGDLRLASGDTDRAQEEYLTALELHPSSPLAQLGRARVRVALGDVPGALAVLEPLVLRLPLAEVVAFHGDVLTVAGREAEAARQYELVRAIEALNASAGGITADLELARFEAAHVHLPGGDAAKALKLATAARANRPTIYADDALAWALHQAGRSDEALPMAQAATRLGTPDATLWWHLAEITAATGDTEGARAALDRAFEISPWFGALETPAAEELRARLG